MNIKNDKFSLLWPNQQEYSVNKLNENTINDLSIDFICEKLTNSDKEQSWIKYILTHLSDNEDVIKYRSDIFEDFLNAPKLSNKLEEQMDQLNYLNQIAFIERGQEASSVWQLIFRLRELDSFSNCLENIIEAFKDVELKSQGLLMLKEMVQKAYKENGFEFISEDVKSLNEKVGKIKSLNLGVNLDENLNPIEVTLISLNETRYDNSTFLKKFLSFTQVMIKNSSSKDIDFGNEFNGITNIGNSMRNDSHSIMNKLTKNVEALIKPTVTDLKKTLNKYISVNINFLTDIISELTYYLRFVKIVKGVQALGMPMCRSKVLNSNNRDMYIKNNYNIKLALYLAEDETKSVNQEIVGNDISFNDDSRIFIMTGPNRGGKTTYTVAIGLSQLLFQGGIYVPGSEASISPVDNIYTHFPIDENKTVELGRLGEEVKRIDEIFDEATEKSLILLNESLATTSHTEGLYIAKDVVKAFRFLGARVLYNTHMHDLADSIDEINNGVDGDSIVASLVTGINDGKRSYKVFIAPPLGISYARDIAEKYGVTFDMIKNKITNNTRNKVLIYK